MTLGVANKQGNLLDDVVRFCDEALPERSIYAFLRRERDQLFPDEAFSDLFEDRGRRSVPPSVVAPAGGCGVPAQIIAAAVNPSDRAAAQVRPGHAVQRWSVAPQSEHGEGGRARQCTHEMTQEGVAGTVHLGVGPV